MTSINGLHDAIDAMSSIDGRKTLVFISAGIPLSKYPGGQPNLDHELARIARRAAAANVNLYVFYMNVHFLRSFSAEYGKQNHSIFEDISMFGYGLEKFADIAGGSFAQIEVDADPFVDRMLRRPRPISGRPCRPSHQTRRQGALHPAVREGTRRHGPAPQGRHHSETGYAAGRLAERRQSRKSTACASARTGSALSTSCPVACTTKRFATTTVTSARRESLFHVSNAGWPPTGAGFSIAVVRAFRVPRGQERRQRSQKQLIERRVGDVEIDRALALLVVAVGARHVDAHRDLLAPAACFASIRGLGQQRPAAPRTPPAWADCCTFCVAGARLFAAVADAA